MVTKYKGIKINGKKIDEHRYIMEQHLGRKLSFNEVVHHKDGNTRNNIISNLKLTIRSNHSRQHMLGQKRDTLTFKNGKYWCNGCKKYLPKSSFHKDVNNKKWCIHNHCKRCRSERYLQKRRQRPCGLVE